MASGDGLLPRGSPGVGAEVPHENHIPSRPAVNKDHDGRRLLASLMNKWATAEVPHRRPLPAGMVGSMHRSPVMHSPRGR